MKRAALGRAFRDATWVMLLGLLFLFPERGVQGALAGLRSCATRLIPALYPFLIVCPMAATSAGLQMAGRLFRPYLRLLGIEPSQAGAAMLTGLLGGFAPAGQCLGHLYRKGALSPRDTQVLLVAVAGAGPGFVVNSVGFLMLGSSPLGWVLITSQFGAGLVCGAATAAILKKAPQTPRVHLPSPPATEPSFPAALREGTRSMLALCGTVVFFQCLLHLLLPFFPPRPALRALTASLLEITSGCQTAAQLPGLSAVYGCCAALSLLSGSVFLQLRAILPEELSLRPLLWSRLLHLPLSLSILRVALLFLPEQAEQAASNTAPALILQTRARPDAALLLFAVCCLALWRLQRASGRAALQANGKQV